MKMIFTTIDNIVAFVSGIVGGSAYIFLAGVWSTVLHNASQLLWAGVISTFSGACGFLGKHLIEKYFKKKNNE